MDFRSRMFFRWCHFSGHRWCPQPWRDFCLPQTRPSLLYLNLAYLYNGWTSLMVVRQRDLRRSPRPFQGWSTLLSSLICLDDIHWGRTALHPWPPYQDPRCLKHVPCYALVHSSRRWTQWNRWRCWSVGTLGINLMRVLRMFRSLQISFPKTTWCKILTYDVWCSLVSVVLLSKDLTNKYKKLLDHES